MIDNEISFTAEDEAQARAEAQAEGYFSHKEEFPYFDSYKELKDLCMVAQKPFQRYGQAVSNYYKLPEDLNQLLWPTNDPFQVHLMVYNYFLSKRQHHATVEIPNKEVVST